jgi:hypothetical protein
VRQRDIHDRGVEDHHQLRDADHHQREPSSRVGRVGVNDVAN